MSTARRRVGFRFGFVFALLIVFPFPFGWFPYTGDVGAILIRPSVWGVELLASLLGLPTPSTEPTGSGDTLFAYLQLLLFAIVTTGVTAVWSLVDRRPTPDARLAAALRVILRYWLAAVMLSYGFAKVVEGQFGSPSHLGLDTRVGDKSPMGLLWTFMGYSRPYTIFAGLAEVSGALLLLSRRTATIGALILLAVLANVVMLDFCYDVPVKLYSSELLLAAIALALPDARRLIAAALGHATADVPPRPRSSAAIERARTFVKAAFLIGVAFMLQAQVSAERRPPPTVIDGAWDVDRCSIDGVERAPLATDGDRWRRAFVSGGALSVRFMDDSRVVWRAHVDDAAKTIVIELRDAPPATWRFTRPDADHLVLDGALAGHRHHVELVRVPDGLLVTRGFHWIQERPFNR